MDDTLVPPTDLDYGIRVEQFRAVGEEYAGHCRELAELAPDHRVLDVGCGFGPLRAALTSYLSPAGRYDGIDAVPTGIGWAAHTITPRFPNFRFAWVDVYNRTYRPGGRIDPREFRFPFPDDEFDLVYLRSVFTHLWPAEVAHYLSEIRRVLRPGGRTLISYFLLTPESLQLMTGPTAARTFSHDYGVYRQSEPGPAGSVAYREDHVLGLYEKHQLTVGGRVYYGRWCGRPTGRSSQDIIVAAKEM